MAFPAISWRDVPATAHFAKLAEPVAHRQHPNEQGGMDLYISVLNIATGEVCFKKLYENSKGLHFKHTGFGSTYLTDFTEVLRYVPYQALRPQPDTPETTP